MNLLRQVCIFSLAGFFLQSCMNDETWVESHKPNLSVDSILNDGGVLILSEGNFMYGNASLSYYNSKKKLIYKDIFFRQNGIPLGDVAQSAVIHDGELCVVLNNSGKIVMMNFGKYSSLKAFDFTNKITGLTSPRYISFIDSSKAYITDLYAKSIKILDPFSLSITDEINVSNNTEDYYQHPTEQIIVLNDEVFTNCYSFDNKILVINKETDTLIDSIEVLQQPNSMVLDKNNKLWVLCDGGYEGSSYGNSSPGLVRIDAVTHTVEKIFILPADNWPSKLCINGSLDTLYFINGDIWRMDIKAQSLPETSFIQANIGNSKRLFYGLGVDPLTSEVYVADAIDHVQQGVVYRYSPEAVGIDTFQVGIIPGGMVFLGKGRR